MAIKIQKHHIVLSKWRPVNVTDVTSGLRSLKWQDQQPEMKSVTSCLISSGQLGFQGGTDAD